MSKEDSGCATPQESVRELMKRHGVSTATELALELESDRRYHADQITRLACAIGAAGENSVDVVTKALSLVSAVAKCDCGVSPGFPHDTRCPAASLSTVATDDYARCLLARVPPYLTVLMSTAKTLDHRGTQATLNEINQYLADTLDAPSARLSRSATAGGMAAKPYRCGSFQCNHPRCGCDAGGDR